MKKLNFLLGVIILFSLFGCHDKKIKEEYTGEKIESIEFNSHTLVHKNDDLKLGTFENIYFNSEKKLVINNSVTRGSYLSPVIITNKFTELVASWNSITPKDSNVELFIRVKQKDNWSQWFSYGKWSFNSTNSSVKNQSDTLARMNIDTIKVNDFADGFQYKIELNRDSTNTSSPLVSLIGATLHLQEEYLEAINLTNIDWHNNIDVPQNSQMVAYLDPRVICSPTSLTMLLRYYDIDYTPEKTALKAKDNGANIYGNWTYNIAVAGELGLDAYVSRLTTIDELKYLIAHNIPVAASITVSDKSQLIGAPMAYPSGHLLIVRGFVLRDDVEYVIVNDPAADDNESVVREYQLDQFINAWKNYVYIVKEH